MSNSTVAEVTALIDVALEAYRDDREALDLLDACFTRITQPLRVALVGMVKAGKSTLLNAILGEEIAPTDTGECTRIVTWYRYGDTPRVTARLVNGKLISLPVIRKDGRLTFELDEYGADEVERLDVEWPSRTLRDITLIDTPGVASTSATVSARSMRFLVPDGAPSEADAVIYLLRHLHETDITLLQSLRDGAAGLSGAINALVVLSRADEAGAGRIDAMISAGAIAERYQADEVLRHLVAAVVPVAGLVAQGARTLRHSEFVALRNLAALDRSEREKLLVSADRFVADPDSPGSRNPGREALLERFGTYGIRLACSLIKGGASTSSSLARELSRRSGLDEILGLLTGRFQARAGFLKADAALSGVERVIRERPHPESGALDASIERIRVSAHELRELHALARLREGALGLEQERLDEAERLLGGRGVSEADRLGLGRDTPSLAVEEEALHALDRWRASAENASDRATANFCLVVVRSCDAVLSGLGHEGRAAPRLLLAPEPLPGRGHETGYERRAG